MILGYESSSIAAQTINTQFSTEELVFTLEMGRTISGSTLVTATIIKTLTYTEFV